MARQPVFSFDIDAAVKLVASQLQPIVSRGADILTEQIKSRIQLQVEPSLPGEFPASPSRGYYDSWRSVGAFVYDDAVVAYAQSNDRQSDGFPAAMALEHGRGETAPRPHIELAIEASRAPVASLIRKTEGGLGDG